MKNSLVYFICICSLLLISCNKSIEDRRYFIYNNDTTAYLENQNDTLLTARINNLRFVSDDSIYHKMLSYYKLSNYRIYIQELSRNKREKLPHRSNLILNGKADTLAYLSFYNNEYNTAFIITPHLKLSSGELKVIIKDFGFKYNKFFISDYTDYDDLSYYASGNADSVDVYNKPFETDTIRLLKYFSSTFPYFREKHDFLKTQDKVIKLAIAIRNIGTFARVCEKRGGTYQMCAKQVIDTLKSYQKYVYWNLRNEYCQMLKEHYKSFSLDLFIDEFFDNQILKVSSYVFLDFNNIQSFSNKHDVVFQFLGIKKIIFSTTLGGQPLFTYTIYPLERFTPIEHIGWREESLYSSNDIISIISSLYPNRFYYN